jgi:tRNA(fMet)-specific endonuclease VapC
MRYLLDTNAAADCMFRRRGVSERAKQVKAVGGVLGIAVPVLAELLGGIEYSASRDANLDVVERHLRLFKLWPFTPAAARVYGRMFAELRRACRMVAVMDLMIAATALELGDCTVVSADSDLLRVPGLRVENWTLSAPR